MMCESWSATLEMSGFHWVISLAFGVVFVTLITLFVIPAEYLILEDLKQIIYKLLGKKTAEELQLESEGAAKGRAL